MCDGGSLWGFYIIFAGAPAFIVFILGIPTLFFCVLYAARWYRVNDLLEMMEDITRCTNAHTHTRTHLST